MLSLKSVHSGIGKGEEGLTYPTVHTFEADHPTVAILQMRRAAYPTVHTQGRGRADLSHCAHFWGWASHCGHFTNEKSCQSHCGHTRARKGWPITLCTLLRLSIPLWAIVQMRRAAYPTVHTQGRGRADLSHCAHFWGWASHCGHFTNEKSCLSHCAHIRARKGWPIPLCTLLRAEHPTVAIVQMRRDAYPTVDTQGRGRADLIPLCTLLRLIIPLWPFYKWEELPIPLCTHKGEEGLTYHTVHTFEAATVVCSASKVCAQCDRQGRGRADLSHCAHFWGWASHCGHFTNEKSCQSHCGHTRARKGWPITLCTHFWGWAYHCGHCTNEKSCLSHCAHTRARKGWPIPLCTLLRLSIPLWPFYKWEELLIPLCTHKGEEGLTYPTVHTFEAEHPTLAIVQMRRDAYPTVHTSALPRPCVSTVG